MASNVDQLASSIVRLKVGERNFDTRRSTLLNSGSPILARLIGGDDEGLRGADNDGDRIFVDGDGDGAASLASELGAYLSIAEASDVGESIVSMLASPSAMVLVSPPTAPPPMPLAALTCPPLLATMLARGASVPAAAACSSCCAAIALYIVHVCVYACMRCMSHTRTHTNGGGRARHQPDTLTPISA